MKFTFTGDHQAAVVATLKGDGRQKLRAWRDAASFEPPASAVWLCDRPGLCAASLLLSDADIDEAAHWVGETFSLPGRALAIDVEADDAGSAYGALVKGLFSRFPGQPAAGRATFPVHVGFQHLTDAMIYDRLSSGRVRVRQIPCPVSMPTRFTAAFGDAIDLEHITVAVSAADGAAHNWKVA